MRQTAKSIFQITIEKEKNEKWFSFLSRRFWQSNNYRETRGEKFHVKDVREEKEKITGNCWWEIMKPNVESITQISSRKFRILLRHLAMEQEELVTFARGSLGTKEESHLQNEHILWHWYLRKQEEGKKFATLKSLGNRKIGMKRTKVYWCGLINFWKRIKNAERTLSRF